MMAASAPRYGASGCRNGETMQGGCSCGAVRYELKDKPIIVHGCHCTWCQRETGSAFAVNAVIETARLVLLSGQPEAIPTPSHSGRGQIINRCPKCHVAVWSHYSTARETAAFIRVGTLDHPHAIQPDIHIFTSTKRPWVMLPENLLSVPEFYNPREVWPEAALNRWAAMMAA
jgi:hypothetical protein